ncbi:MAG: aminoglycoside phosphotransferase family protein [Bosea sp. (in: a-proteobacteria)]
MALSDAELMSTAAKLVAHAGRARPDRLEQLAGGKNNRVFRLELADGTPLILKSYFSHPGDKRDRLSAEWNFLVHAKRCGLGSVPDPLARDDETRTGLYSFVPGQKLAAEAISETHIDAAAALIRDINRSPRQFDGIAFGSEACFSLAEHLATMDRRVAQLDALDSAVPNVEQAQQLVELRLVPTWQRVRARLVADAAAAGFPMEAHLPDRDVILSPSDFGFHNALASSNGQITFIDFEYAGRDDPAKMVCDFFCQPEVPIALKHFDRFVEGALAEAGLASQYGRRCQILLDAYRIKWLCIILNDFLPIGAARRQFASSEHWAARTEGQLTKAKARLDMLS